MVGIFRYIHKPLGGISARCLQFSRDVCALLETLIVEEFTAVYESNVFMKYPSSTSISISMYIPQITDFTTFASFWKSVHPVLVTSNQLNCNILKSQEDGVA